MFLAGFEIVIPECGWPKTVRENTQILRQISVQNRDTVVDILISLRPNNREIVIRLPAVSEKCLSSPNCPAYPCGPPRLLSSRYWQFFARRKVTGVISCALASI